MTEPSLNQSQSIGRHLSDARDQQNLTIEQVAKELNMPPATILALEEENFSVVPQLAFLKGYLRSYANLLGLDADQIMAQFKAQHDTSETPTFSSTHGNTKAFKMPELKPRNNKRWLVIGLVVLVLTAVLLALMNLLGQSSTELPINSKLQGVFSKLDAPNAVSQPNGQATATDGDKATTIAQNTPTTSNAATATVLAGSGSTNATSDTVANTANNTNDNNSSGQSTQPSIVQNVTLFTPASGNYSEPVIDKVALKFTGPATVTIKDADGQTLFTGTKNSNDQLNLQGIAPFSINAKGTPNIKLSLNNDPVDLNLYSVNGRAEFRLSH